MKKFVDVKKSFPNVFRLGKIAFSDYVSFAPKHYFSFYFLFQTYFQSFFLFWEKSLHFVGGRFMQSHFITVIIAGIHNECVQGAVGGHREAA